jgi:hypothetical protein
VVGIAMQHASGAHEYWHLFGLRGGGEFFIEYAGEREQVVALVLQRDAQHWAYAARILMLAYPQLRDDKIEQRLWSMLFRIPLLPCKRRMRYAYGTPYQVFPRQA